MSLGSYNEKSGESLPVSKSPRACEVHASIIVLARGSLGLLEVVTSIQGEQAVVKLESEGVRLEKGQAGHSDDDALCLLARPA